MANSLLNSNGTLNVENYNDKVRKQRETFSKIDAAMASLEKLPAYTNFSYGGSFSFSYNPLGFLFNLIRVLGVDEETLREWITEILVYTLPAVEIGVKAALLANLKGLISCNADPRIPLRLRKRLMANIYTNILTGLKSDRGIDINIDAIDPNGILDLSPFTEPGSNYYFGIPEDLETTVESDEGATTSGNFSERVTSQVRADDFNAFLWYVIHKGNKQNPAPIKILEDTVIIDGDEENKYDIVSQNKTLLGELILSPQKNDTIVPGNTFYEESSPTNIAICIKVDDEGDKVLVPVSSDWYSCNWYVDKTNYYKSNLGVEEPAPRNYKEEKGICNLQFWKEYDWRGREIMGHPNSLRFTILPKPYVLLPSLDIDDSAEQLGQVHVQWRPIILLFNANGEPDPKGNFSLISETYNLTPTLSNKITVGDETTYTVKGIVNGELENVATLAINIKTGKYRLEGSNPTAALVECYPGLTVYEFNYDYVMGMKLFDPKVVCQRLFDNAADPRFNATFTISRLKDRTRYPYYGAKQRVLAIVKSILEEEDDEELSDCFYGFSNEAYDEMLKETEEMKYRQIPFNQGYNRSFSADFSEAYKILESLDSNSSLEDQKYKINMALRKACIILDERDHLTSISDSSTIKIDFLTSLLQNLIAAIVDSVLSPKVLMLLIVNRALIKPGDDKPFDAEDLIKILKNIVKSLVKEIRDLIMKKLLDYILNYLSPLALELKAKIQREQFAAYMAIMRLLLAWFNKGVEVVMRLSSILSALFSRNKYRTGSNMDNTEIDLPTILDNFTYADIYPNDIKDKQPINNNC